MGRTNELVKLIDAASKAGVKHLKFGDLEVDFVGKEPEVEQATEMAPEPEREVHESDIELAKEQAMAELLVENPEIYEKLQLGEGVPGLGI
jgi:hypothetical protein